MKKICLIIFVLFSIVAPAQRTKETKPAAKSIVEDLLKTPNLLEINGFIGEKLDASYKNRILAQDVERLVEPFRNRTETNCWQSEFWGKWFTSAVLAYKYCPTPELKAVIDKAAISLMATQTPDGYIGNYVEKNHLKDWDIWGRKYCMLGLLAYYDITGDKNTLQSVIKLADNLIDEIGKSEIPISLMGNYRGMAASSVLEPICQLYVYTGEKRFLNFAEQIVKLWEVDGGPALISKADVDVARRFPPAKNWYSPEQGQKAYEMMSCYEGLLELYRLTGNEIFKTAVEKTWQNILDTEINIAGSGAAAECWFGGKHFQTLPIYHFQETCVTVTWIKLNFQLLRLTGEAKYADAIELAFYNSLLGAMNSDGSDWAKYTPLSGLRREGSEQCRMGLNCCNASGPRALFLFPLAAVMQSDKGVQVNFYTEGTYHAQTPEKQNITVTQKTDYPVSGKVRIKISVSKSENMTLSLRIPEWSLQTTATVNGEKLNHIESGKNLNISRIWKNDDVIELDLDMRGRLVQMNELPEYKAIVRGPIVLARDTRLSGPVIEAIINPVSDQNGFVNLEPAPSKTPNVWMEFQTQVIPESYKEGGSAPVPAVFCDYASAGNAIDEKNAFKVWLPQLVHPSNLYDK